MTDQNKLKEKMPNSLELSISNLWEQFGSTDSYIAGLLVNITLAATGVAIMLLFDSLILSTAGAGWAIFNLIGIIKWVFGL